MASLVWGTASNRRKPYQESKEPDKPQESGLSPKKYESNVLEHCHDGGTNCMLTTTPVSCPTQHHVGDGGYPSSTLW
jgi:hypothetical protein